MKVIVKKIRPKYFEEILRGNKTFELRKEDDVQYKEGDILILKEIEPTVLVSYTGRFAISRIGFVLRKFEGLKNNYAIISLKDIQFCDLSVRQTTSQRHGVYIARKRNYNARSRKNRNDIYKNRIRRRRRMNEKEVIKVLKRFYPTEIVLKSDSTGMIHENKEALDIAIKSVKKQIPMQVYLQGDGYFDGELVLDTAICQNCGAAYEVDYEHFKYCPNCGQKLDWLEVEENDN